MNELIFDIKKHLVPLVKVLRVRGDATQNDIDRLIETNPAHHHVIVRIVGRTDTEPTITRQEK